MVGALRCFSFLTDFGSLRGTHSECEEDSTGPGTAEGSSCHPTEGEARFVCGMRIMMPSALRNQGNVPVLFSSQVHVLRDVPALKADNGRTF